MQEESELVCLPARARGLVGSREALHVLDEVLGGPACAEHLLVERLAPTGEAGDDEACVRAEARGLYTGDELAPAAPLAALVEQADGSDVRGACIWIGGPRTARARALQSRGAWS